MKMDKRAAQRTHYSEEDHRQKLYKQHEERIAKLESLQSTFIGATNHLIKFLSSATGKVEVVNQLKEISTPDSEKVEKAILALAADIKKNRPDLEPAFKLLKAMQAELAKIPKEHAKFEQKDSFKVTNLDEINFDTTNIEKLLKEAIKKLSVEQKAPVVNVEGAKFDTKSLETILSNIYKAITAKSPEKLPESFKISNLSEIEKVDLTKLEKSAEDGNKLLKKISERPMGGGGGGGNGTPYTDEEGRPKNVILEKGRIPVEAEVWGLYAHKVDSATISYTVQKDINNNWRVLKIDTTSGYDISHADVDNNPLITTAADALTNRATLTYELGAF